MENDTGKVKIILIKQQLDLLIADYNDNIRFILSSMESYDMFFIAQTQFETSTNESFNELYDQISTLAQNRGKIAKLQQQETNQSFSQLINSIIFIGIILVIGTIFIAFLTTLSITKPVQRLKNYSLLALEKEYSQITEMLKWVMTKLVKCQRQ